MARSILMHGEGDTLWLPGDGSNWEDLRFPVQGINPVGPTSPPDISNVDGALLFDAGTIQLIAGFAQMPHSWKQGSAIHPHIHWQASDGNSGDVVWKLEYDISNINGNFAGSYASNSKTVAVPESATKHILTTFDNIEMSGKVVSCIIKWRISRTANAAEDTYAADARLLEVDFHYEIDSIGSGVVAPPKY